MPSTPYPRARAAQSAVDANTQQEAGRSLVFKGRGVAAIVGEPVNLTRQTTGKMTVGIRSRLDAPVQGPVIMAMGHSLNVLQTIDVSKALTAPVGEWKTLKITLDCFVTAGQDMNAVSIPFAIASEKPLSISYSSIKLESDEGDATGPAK